MKYIDIAAGIKESESRFLKKLPGFMIRLIEKIIKQDELNVILEKYKDCAGAEFHRSIREEFNFTLIPEGLENLPEEGKCFFLANHPFGILDGLCLTKTVLEKYGTFKAIGNESFFFIPNLRPYIALVNPYGISSKAYVTELEKVYRSEVPITHFPAGEVSRRYNHKVQDCAWQKSFISRAVACQRDIVPFYFYGRNSNLFYGINLLRRAFGVKTNIELILLPRELFLKRNCVVRFKIGKPISWKSFDRSQTPIQWAQKVRDHVYRMSGNEGTQLDFNTGESAGSPK
jgi:putative hemolysin